jgi:hypothetical protein
MGLNQQPHLRSIEFPRSWSFRKNIVVGYCGSTEDTKMYIDNRDAGQMYDYLESRIEALKKRISELESENEKLRWESTSLEPEFAHS